ncbi:hypothetical protein [Mycobacterium malmoense]|uniref:hypothetical protein n=1 Tax=Mycobacterium malmoense TaxID=1780 RepID=UPI001C4012B1|nr:hypothetical protein [Mycobacterium malmoense]
MDRNLTIERLLGAGAVDQHAAQNPPWSMPLLVTGIVILAVSAIPFFLEVGQSRRRLYWLAYLLGTVTMAIALSPRGWKASVGMCIAGAAVAVLFAFFYDGSLLKSGNRQFSYTLPPEQRSEAPAADTYLGVVPARNHWWLIAVGSCAFAYGIYLVGWAWEISTSVAAGVVLAAVSGWDDGARGMAIARGQRVQFVIASIASIMMFALPLLAYVAAYFGAKRWAIPPRRHAVGGDAGEPPD